MINPRGQKLGTQRGDRRRFPYEPRVVGGKLLMPAELQAIHRYVVETPVLKTVTEEIRAVMETVIEASAKALRCPLKLRPTGLGSGAYKDKYRLQRLQRRVVDRPHLRSPRRPRASTVVLGDALPQQAGEPSHRQLRGHAGGGKGGV
jgi:hypothetical protein